jgi:hypothetical protein
MMMSAATELEARIKRAGGGDLKSTRVPGVFRIAEPLTPKGAERVGTVKRDLLRILADALPHCAIYLDAHDADLLAAIDRAPPKNVAATVPHWLFLDAAELEKLAPMLYRGAWGLFFGEPNALSSAGPEQLTLDELEALALTRRVGAAASVFSWYDDVDWLICIIGQRVASAT